MQPTEPLITPVCDLTQVFLLGKKTNGKFVFHNNFRYDSAGKTLEVGEANPDTGAITNVTCNHPIVGRRLKVTVFVDNNLVDHRFKFEEVPLEPTNLMCSLLNNQNPKFTISNDGGTLSFIGIEDVRTGKAELKMPAISGLPPKGVFLEFDVNQNRLLISA
jgi:hypothetical protein